MSEMVMGSSCQPVFWAIGLLAYAVSAALVAIACGMLVGAVGYLVFRKSGKRAVRLGLPSLMAVVSIYFTFVGIFCVLCLWFSGIFATPDERLLTPTQPVSEEDMVGTYALDSSSLEIMERAGYEISTHTLTISDDGTFELVNMPDWWGFGDPPTGGCYSTSGTWKITEYSGEWGLSVFLDSAPEFPNGVYTQYEIGGEEPPYYIWTWAGDPDAGRVMVFERQ